MLLLFTDSITHLLQRFIREGELFIHREINGFTLVLWEQATQRCIRRSRAICRWCGISFNVVPELALQFDQLCNHCFVTLDTVDIQVLPTEQYSNVSSLFAGDG